MATTGARFGEAYDVLPCIALHCPACPAFLAPEGVRASAVAWTRGENNDLLAQVSDEDTVLTSCLQSVSTHLGCPPRSPTELGMDPQPDPYTTAGETCSLGSVSLWCPVFVGGGCVQCRRSQAARRSRPASRPAGQERAGEDQNGDEAVHGLARRSIQEPCEKGSDRICMTLGVRRACNMMWHTYCANCQLLSALYCLSLLSSLFSLLSSLFSLLSPMI